MFRVHGRLYRTVVSESMRITWAGRLFAASVGAALVGAGLRKMASMIPSSAELHADCPLCNTTCVVSGPGIYICHECSAKFNVRE